MAQELDVIVNLLKEIKKANSTSTKSFDKLLSGISDKLEVMDKSSDSSDLIKAYIEELTKTMDEKYSTTLLRFSDIENAMKSLFVAQDANAKDTFVKDLFNNFEKQLNRFHEEVLSQKAIIDNINEDLSQINLEKSSRNDVLDAINVTKNYFEKLNTEYEKSTNEINDSLNSILSEIAELKDPTITNKICEQTDIIYKATTEIIESLKSIEEHENILEKLLSNVATNESLKLTQGAVESIIQKSDEISEQLKNLALKSDIDSLSDKLEKDFDNNVPKECLEEISKTSETLLNQTNEIKMSLAEFTKNIETISDTKTLEKSFGTLFKDFAKFSENIENIQGLENLADVNLKISEFSKELSVIKNIVEDLKDVILSKISKEIDNLAENKQSSNIQEQVSKIITLLPKQEDIEKILKVNKETKTTLETVQKSVETIDSKTDEIENMIDRLNFDEEFKNIYSKASSIEDWLIDSKIKENAEEILEKINKEELSKTSENKESEIQDKLTEIKNILSDKKFGIENLNDKIQSDIENYLSDVKVLLEKLDNTELQNQLSNIEEKLGNYKSDNEHVISQVLSAIDELKPNNTNIEASIDEIKEIKTLLSSLGDSFENLSNNDSVNQRNISTFLAEKLNELSTDLTNVVDGVENKINTSFVYNAELIEEKTGVLLELIKELRHSNSDNIDLYERLTVTDNKLIDVKQELELVNTDIINNLSSTTSQLLSEITPMKDSLVQLISAQGSDIQQKDLQEQISIFHEAVKEELSQTQNYSKANYDKLEDIYTKLSNEIIVNENNLRDFILSDIDSVIIKLDTVKSDWEETLDKISLPSVEDMTELKNFCAQINEFKEGQKALLSEFAQDIKKSITEQLAHDREDIKSLLVLANNNEEILNAIENLKQNFITKLENYSVPTVDDDFGINDYEKEFEPEENQKTIKELQDDFDKFSTLLAELSDKNPELEEVLSQMKEKISEISQPSKDIDIDIIENGTQDSNEEKEHFDILKALDLLKEDIKTLQADIQNSNPVDKTWLDEVKNYISGNDVKSMLDIINQKIDILASSDNTEDFDSIRETLESIENKLDLTVFPEISENDNSKRLSDSDAKITSMLELLNHKIDILASDDNTDAIYALDDVRDLILSQQDSISNLEKNDKTEAFRKCLDELTNEVNSINTDNSQQIQKSLKEMKESIMSAVVTIFEQVSFIEESEDIKDFVEEKTDEINKNLVEVTEQLKQISNNNAENDYNYSMQDIESDLAKLRLALNELKGNEDDEQTEKLSSILDNISLLGSTVENLQNSICQEEEFSDMKTKINQLVISSDESYNTLGKILTDQLSKKVDNVTTLLEKSNASDKVMRQALIYMGEWIDSASESMNKISSNSDEIIDIKSAIEMLKSSIPEHTNILSSIEEKFDEQQERLAFFEKQISKLGSLEDSFDQQQDRINRLEMSLEKILSVVEELDDSKVSRKIDKIEKQLTKLSTNIEKLASYVD